jgi:hypothetical protein
MMTVRGAFSQSGLVFLKSGFLKRLFLILSSKNPMIKKEDGTE